MTIKSKKKPCYLGKKMKIVSQETISWFHKWIWVPHPKYFGIIFCPDSVVYIPTSTVVHKPMIGKKGGGKGEGKKKNQF